MTRWRRIVSWRGLLPLCVIIGCALAAAASQPSQGEINVEQHFRMEQFDRRLDHLERDDLSGRLKVLESDMWEVKWLARGAALAVISQIVVGLGRRKPEIAE